MTLAARYGCDGESAAVTASLSELVEATPASRDRYVDFLRALSIGAVVVGHWTIGLIAWDQGVIRSTSAIGKAPGLWLATWVFQVMPVFFFVGGFANLVAYEAARRRGQSVWTFIRSRVRRLLVPSLALMAGWAAVEIALHLTDTGGPTGPRFGGFVLLRGVRPPGQTIPFGPLWFLAVYVVVVCLSPATVVLHRRYRWWIPTILVAGAVAVDAAGFVGGVPRIRYLNVAFVFLLPHQLGHFYGDHSIDRWPRAAPIAMVAVGLGGLVALTNPWLLRLAGDDRFGWFPGIGHYPRSLLGTDVERISNAYPPTVCFLLGGIWLIGLVLLARPAVTGWLARAGPWKAVVAANSRIMTLFLWHMTAYLIAIIVLWPSHFGRQTTPTLRWWMERPVWIVAPGMILAVLVALFGRLETRGHRALERAPTQRSS